MKVLDLQCSQGHVFEGWFASEEDFQSQKQCDLVQCPLCNDHQVHKLLSAPRLNLGARPPGPARSGHDANQPAHPDAGGGSSGSAQGALTTAVVPFDQGDAALLPQAIQAAWLRLARHIASNTEDVGAAFAQEARRIHHGEAPERGIRGQATAEEALELLEEGVAVLPLPLPVSAKETLQ
ncbi:DUF1178 family protein [Acidovorax sp. BL-A-41-H1]|uniref:DUF1178 family protein n=1 Tax=Acidovorax sp. BL-A-41-H1 TaxID=3421102 RepID=UPI003F78F8DD